MLPANPDDLLHVHRVIDADPDDLLDAITDFAVEQDLEVDRTFDGEGLLFRRKREPGTDVEHLLRRGDTLQVVVLPDPAGGHEVEFVADLAGSIRHKAESRRAGAFRAGAWAAGFAVVAAINLAKGVEIGDFIWVLLAARSSRHVAQAVGPSTEDVEDLQRNVANTLHALLDRV
jgi:hypothetical protein